MIIAANYPRLFSFAWCFTRCLLIGERAVQWLCLNGIIDQVPSVQMMSVEKDFIVRFKLAPLDSSSDTVDVFTGGSQVLQLPVYI